MFPLAIFDKIPNVLIKDLPSHYHFLGEPSMLHLYRKFQICMTLLMLTLESRCIPVVGGGVILRTLPNR